MNCEHHRKSFNSIYIIPLTSPGKITGLYIYRRQIFLLCPMPCKEKFPRKEGFLGGYNTAENGARKSFGGSVLKCPV